MEADIFDQAAKEAAEQNRKRLALCDAAPELLGCLKEAYERLPHSVFKAIQQCGNRSEALSALAFSRRCFSAIEKAEGK